jgi:hypothetical protein
VASLAAQNAQRTDEVAAVALATRALAEQLLVPADALTVVRVSPAEWRDSSLGCPERGQVYRPQIVSGHDVRLRHDGREHAVHVGGGRAVVCGVSGGSGKVSSGAVLTPARRAGEAVKEAIARRAGVAAADVRVDRSRPFRAGATACPSAPAQARGPAFVIDARAAGATFVYYADDEVTLSCDAPPAR